MKIDRQNGTVTLNASEMKKWDSLGSAGFDLRMQLKDIVCTMVRATNKPVKVYGAGRQAWMLYQATPESCDLERLTYRGPA